MPSHRDGSFEQPKSMYERMIRSIKFFSLCIMLFCYIFAALALRSAIPKYPLQFRFGKGLGWGTMFFKNSNSVKSTADPDLDQNCIQYTSIFECLLSDIFGDTFYSISVDVINKKYKHVLGAQEERSPRHFS